MGKKFIFVYITTNLINGKQYVGDHATNKIDDGYLGSRRLIDKAIKKYEKCNFKLEILEQFNSKTESFNAQEKYIIQYNTLSPNGYNLSPKGGRGVSGCFSEETLKKLSEANKGKFKGKKLSKDHIVKLSLKKKGKLWEEIFGLEEAEKRRKELKQRLANNHPLKEKKGQEQAIFYLKKQRNK